jgi:transposase
MSVLRELRSAPDFHMRLQMLRTSALELERYNERTRRRLMAVADVLSETPIPEVAQALGVASRTLSRYVRHYALRGVDALLYRNAGGRPPSLTSEQCRRVREAIHEKTMSTQAPTKRLFIETSRDTLNVVISPSSAKRYRRRLWREEE